MDSRRCRQDENRESITVNARNPEHCDWFVKSLASCDVHFPRDYVSDGQELLIGDPTDYAPWCRPHQLDGEYLRHCRDTSSHGCSPYWQTKESFIRTMANLESIAVVRLELRLHTHDLARFLADMNETDKYGHIMQTNEGGYISYTIFAESSLPPSTSKNTVLRRFRQTAE